MRVTRIRALRGPNLWSQRTSMEVVVSFGETGPAIEKSPGFEARLRALFPEIPPQRAIDFHPALTLVHAFERAALGLQVQAGCPVTFSWLAQTLEPGTY